MANRIPEIDVEKCTGCGECVETCPPQATAMVDHKAVIVRQEDCTYCTDCEAVCPSGAIQCYYEIVMQEQ